MALDLGKFKLKKVILELRYANAYLLWDRAGEIWSRAEMKWPGLNLKKAEPGATIFAYENRFELGINLDKTFIVGHDPKPDLEQFSDYTGIFSDIAKDSLGLSEYNRLGLRVFYERKYDGKNSASQALFGSVDLPQPSGKHFNVSGKVVQPEFALRWEGQAIGVRASLAVQSRKIDFDAPLGVDEFSSIHAEVDLLVLDVDYYTLARIGVGQFQAKEWIQQAHHLIKRDIDTFLIGG